MATSDLEVRIRDQYQGAGVGKLGDELERVNRNAGTAQRGMLPLVATIGDVMNIAGQAGRVFETAFDLAKEGAGIQRTNMQLERLAATVDTTADAIMTRLREATRGMITDAELAASATQIISLGLGKTEGDVVRLATVVGQLGLDMNQVILTFANNSAMRLDALGLAVDDVRARAKAFEEQGFDADKAFDTAVLEALEARLETLGGGVDDNAKVIQEFSTGITNATDRVKVFLAEGLTPWMRLLNGEYSAAVRNAALEGVRNAESIAGMGEAGQKAAESAQEYLAQLEALRTGIGRNAEAFNEAQDDVKGFGEAVIQALDIQTVDEFVAAMQQISGESGWRATEGFTALYYSITAFDTAASTAEVSARALAAQAAELDARQRELYESAVLSSRAQYEQSSAFQAAQESAAGYVDVSGEVIALMQRYPDIVREMTAAMAEQREVNRQLQAEFNAGITSYLQGADAADFYTTAFDELGRTTYTYTTIAGGNREELERLQRVYDQTLQDIRDYDAGIKGVTLSEDARARKLDELREKAGNTQAAMAGLGTVTTVTGSTFNAAEFDTQKLRAALLEQSLAAGADTFQIQQLMEATGQYSDEQIRAALNAAAMQEKIEALAGMIAEGTITVEDAIERLDDFAEALAQPFGIYIETGPLKGAISDLEKLIALYGTAAGLAGAIDAGELGGGGSGSGSSAGTGGTTGGGDTFNQGGNTGMAAGGYVAAAQPYLVGERGPELFVPAQGGYVVNNSDLRGGGQDINIYIQDAGSLHLRGQIVDATGLLADQLGVRG